MISVCIATFNGASFIEEQLNSILPQIGLNDEIIISDDNSTDNTIEIVKSINDKRIRILKNCNSDESIETIKKITSNFENALKNAKGDIIFLADQDDVWLKNKVKCSLKYLKQFDYIVSDCYVTDHNLNIIYNTRFYPGSRFTKNKWKALVKPTPYQGSCAAFNRKVLNKALPFPKNIQSHDRWIGYVASFFFNYKIIPELLILYRRHGENISTATENSQSSIYYKIRTRFVYIFELIKLNLKKNNY